MLLWPTLPGVQENWSSHNVPLSETLLIVIVHYCRIVLRTRMEASVQDEQFNKVLHFSICIDVLKLPVQSVERSVLFLTVEWVVSVVSRRTSLFVISRLIYWAWMKCNRKQEIRVNHVLAGTRKCVSFYSFHKVIVNHAVKFTWKLNIVMSRKIVWVTKQRRHKQQTKGSVDKPGNSEKCILQKTHKKFHYE